MESPEFFLAGSFRAGPPQMSQEMKFCDIKSADFFPIEDLLDFSNEDASGLPDVAAAGNSTDSSTITVAETAGSCNSSFSGDCRKLTDSHFPGELCVPYDDLPELEWLSNFVEDSFSSDDFQKLQIVTGINAKDDALGASEYKCSADNPSSELTPARQNPSFNPDAAVPARARSKRSRTAACNWSSRLVVLSPTTSSSGSSDVIADVAQGVPKETGKVVRRREISEHPEGRKCLHCATDKTPQWRTGPLGPKTLCNACGVRYKSGRLVPEYRPAASPTFVLTKHSNSHRKVLDLRRQKEMQSSQQQFLQQAAGVFDVSTGSNASDEFFIQTGPDFRHLI